MNREVDDRMIWIKSKSKFFSVKNTFMASWYWEVSFFPNGIIWNSLALPKASFFAWEAI